MERQRAEARKAWSGSGEAATETIWFGLSERLGATEFLGYETESAEGVALAILKDGAEVASLAAGEKGALILNQTPFYGESGGQVGDSESCSAPGSGSRARHPQEARRSLRPRGRRRGGHARVGAALALQVDHAARSAIRANHSATHLLHEALRIVLGDHVAQKGSLVAPDRLRFDIAHPKPITRRRDRRGRGHRQPRSCCRTSPS